MGFTYPIGLLAPKGALGTDAFILTINTALGTGTTFTLPLPIGQTYDFYWTPYDGATPLHVTAYNDANITYDYGVHGIYQVSISGKCGGWVQNSTDRLKIVSIDQWGNIGVDYAVEGFYTCSNLASIPDAPLTWTNLTSLLRFFGQDTNLTSAIPNGFLDLMVNVTDTSSMFLNCAKLSGSIPSELCRYMPLTTVANMFYQCYLLTGVGEDVFYYNSSITNYSYAFYRCRNLVLPTRMFNLSNISIVTNFSNFMNASSTAYSNTGTIQDIWNYTSATSTNAFLNQTSLSNYVSIPNSWKGL